MGLFSRKKKASPTPTKAPSVTNPEPFLDMANVVLNLKDPWANSHIERYVFEFYSDPFNKKVVNRGDAYWPSSMNMQYVSNIEVYFRDGSVFRVRDDGTQVAAAPETEGVSDEAFEKYRQKLLKKTR